MFLKKKITKSINTYLAEIKRLKYEIDNAEAIVIGAGSGLSTSAGLTYSGERFEKIFSDFIEKYNFKDMYSAGFYPFDTLEEYWGYWSRHIYYNRYSQPVGKVYRDLLRLMDKKEYFVITTNVDHCFQLAGFDKQRLFYTQGDYGLFQCSKSCHNKTYDNKKIIKDMVSKQKDTKIPSSLIPYCPVCGSPMTTNLRIDSTFVEDKGWKTAYNNYEEFLKKHTNSRILYLELGVGANTPGIIKYPFWQMTYKNPNAIYACINLQESIAPKEIEKQSICINSDITNVLSLLI